MTSQQGFTLIEILVVIFIISIVTSVALLTISHNDNRQLESFTRELMQSLTLAEEKAMLEPAVLGVTLDKQSWQFSSFQPAAGKNKAAWLDAQHLVIPSNIDVSIDSKAIPQIVISTNGDITPFTIYIARKGKAPRYAITGDANGNISSRLLS